MGPRSEALNHIRLLTIPREIMEKNRTDVPVFFEVAVLEAEAVYSKVGGKRKVDIQLKRFLPSLAEVHRRVMGYFDAQERIFETGAA